MPRFSLSSILTGCLLTIVLATISTKLHAETQVQGSVTKQMPSNPSNSLPVQSGRDRQDPNRSSTGDAPPTKLDSRSAPVEGANTSTPSKPVTNNNPIPTPKPTTAATSKPPVEDVISLVLKLKEKRVYVYKGDKVIKKYPVAIGKKGWETPTGEWQVMEKIKNPAWTSFKTGEVFKPGTENPLGSRWIGFWTDGQDVIGFHGTSNLKSIGTAASHGCVRMFNRDVKALFPLVKVGTVVKVVNE
jgi:lipoprotein-anchoring transpeptidase ErfK/SrfK